jgi:hypothetical protein
VIYKKNKNNIKNQLKKKYYKDIQTKLSDYILL